MTFTGLDVKQLQGHSGSRLQEASKASAMKVCTLRTEEEDASIPGGCAGSEGSGKASCGQTSLRNKGV